LSLCVCVEWQNNYLSPSFGMLSYLCFGCDLWVVRLVMCGAIYSATKCQSKCELN
jgi:hypothetical protein